ncbi:MAG: hypothetical protein GXX79_05260 [Actinomycetales bacterium]|nr:hypothetical protein [Actinomycetales bacterium]
MDHDAIRATRRRRKQMIVLAGVFFIVFIGRLVADALRRAARAYPALFDHWQIAKPQPRDWMTGTV